MRAYYVGTHHNSYRQGEPGEIIRVMFVKPDNKSPIRPCFHIRYADGIEDYSPISATGNYKIVKASDVKIVASLREDAEG